MSETGYSEPVSVDEVLALLAEDEDATCLAGGASLVAMINARLVEPSALISLRRVEELKSIESVSDGSVRIGAGVRHVEIAAAAGLDSGQAVLAKAAALIANPVIREMGTIGGSVGHFDPAADYPVALVVLGAEIEIAGKGGRRAVAADEFFLDWYTTALEPGEMVTAVVVPPAPAGSAGVYEKLAKVEGDMGVAMVALVMAQDGGIISHLSVGVGGCGPAPVRLAGQEQALIGKAYDAEAIRSLGEAMAAASDPVDDVRASAEYRKILIPRMVSRAADTARRELASGA